MNNYRIIQSYNNTIKNATGKIALQNLNKQTFETKIAKLKN